MSNWLNAHWHLLWMTAAVALIVYLGSPRYRGLIAFQRVKQLLDQGLNKRSYTVFHQLRLPAGGGSELLDHAVVSRFGVFVIVSEHRPGAISGGEVQEFWKQRRLGRTRRWFNPVQRARMQMGVLERLLDMPRKCFHVVVAIGGQDRLPKELPHQVVAIDRLLAFIRGKSDQLLTPEQADKAAARIRAARIPLGHKVIAASLVRMGLAIAVLLGIYLHYGDELRDLPRNFSERIERMASPERFDELGRRKTERQIFEESLICAYSADASRCSCYRKGGEKVEVDLPLCQKLSEKGSILKQ